MNDLTYIQEKFVNYIEKIIQSNKLSHSYLIELGDFSLDFPLVLLFVKMILCSEMVADVENLNCNRCNTCKLIDENSFPDLQIIEAEGSQIKKNQLLSLKGEYQNKSLIGKRRVYIIKNAEKLNPSSANTILKFLEEPEEGVIAILLTSNRYQILDTILSRCQVLSLLDDSETEIVDDKIIVFMRYLIHSEDLFIHYKEIYDSILSDKETAREIFFAVEKILINYLSTKSRNKNSSIFSFLDNVNANILLSYITIIEEEIPKLVYNINYKLWLDCIYSRFVEVK
ncbi:MAG: hypothetical protein SOU84_06915 [Candidatus Faecimonas sp.]|nr:hypothetical protein [Candidatus Faecimonas sp.]